MGPGSARTNGVRFRRAVSHFAMRLGRSPFAAAAPRPNARPSRYRPATGQLAICRRSVAPASRGTHDRPGTPQAAAPGEFRALALWEARPGRRHGAVRYNPRHARDTATLMLQLLASSISTARNPSLSYLAEQLDFRSMTIGKRISFAAGCRTGSM